MELISKDYIGFRREGIGWTIAVEEEVWIICKVGKMVDGTENGVFLPLSSLECFMIFACFIFGGFNNVGFRLIYKFYLFC